MNTPRIVYVVHSGQAFGTERIALATLKALTVQGAPLLVAPAGPAHELAASMGIASAPFSTPWQLARLLERVLRTPGSLLLTTGLVHTLVATALRLLRPGRFRELHVVHGGTDERLSYGRKHLVARLGVRLVAISRFVCERLIAHGVPAQAITVVPNFMDSTGGPTAATAADVQRVVVVSRADRIKQLNLLAQALRLEPELQTLHVDVLGSGEDLEALRKDAADLPNLRFHGYVSDVPRWLARADLLVHTCPTEPFGLAILEAFRAGVPVLVPDAGGASEIVQHGKTGWHYQAGNAQALATQLLQACGASGEERRKLASQAREELAHRYSPETIAPILWSLA